MQCMVRRSCVRVLAVIIAVLPIGPTARKTDELRALRLIGLRDLARHMMSAFDQIGDDGEIADALAAIGAQKSAHGVSSNGLLA